MADDIFNALYSSPMAMAGLGVLSGQNLSQALKQGAAQSYEYQKQQQKQAEYDQNRQAMAKLPEIMRGLDLSNPTAALATLIQSGLDPELSVGLIKTELQKRSLDLEASNIARKSQASTDLLNVVQSMDFGGAGTDTIAGGQDLPMGGAGEDNVSGGDTFDKRKAAKAMLMLGVQAGSPELIGKAFELRANAATSPTAAKEGENIGKEQATYYKEALDKSVAAGDLLQKLDEFESVLPGAGQTGPIAGMLPNAVATLFSGNTADRQRFETLANDVALGKAQLLKGALSDKDIEFVKSLAPTLKNEEEANAVNVAVTRATAQRAQEKVAFLDNYRKQTGGLDGAETAWNKYVNENPLFAKPKEAPKKEIKFLGFE